MGESNWFVTLLWHHNFGTRLLKNVLQSSDTFIRDAISYHIWLSGCTIWSFALKFVERSSVEDRGDVLVQVK